MLLLWLGGLVACYFGILAKNEPSQGSLKQKDESMVDVVDQDDDNEPPLIPFNCIRLYRKHIHRFKGRAYGNLMSNDFRMKLLKKSDFQTNENRGTGNKPWLCSPDIQWKDLGPDYFPRFVKTVNCPQGSCFYGIYSCRAKPYQLTVLHRRDVGAALQLRLNQSGVLCLSDDKSDDASTTSPTQHVWEFRDVYISVDCDCV